MASILLTPVTISKGKVSEVRYVARSVLTSEVEIIARDESSVGRVLDTTERGEVVVTSLVVGVLAISAGQLRVLAVVLGLSHSDYPQLTMIATRGGIGIERWMGWERCGAVCFSATASIYPCEVRGQAARAESVDH